MNFNLTEQQQQIVDQVREFTAQRLAPGVLERDEQQVFPVEAFKEFGAMGMFRIRRHRRRLPPVYLSRRRSF